MIDPDLSILTEITNRAALLAAHPLGTALLAIIGVIVLGRVLWAYLYER